MKKETKTKETKETKPFVINPDDVAAGRIYICRNGARVTLAPRESVEKGGSIFAYRIKEVIGPQNPEGPREHYSYTKEGSRFAALEVDCDITCLETLAEPEITQVKPKPTPRKSFIRTGVIKSVRVQKDGRLKIRVDISVGQAKGIRQVNLNFPYAKMKAGHIVDMTFMTEMLVTDKGEAECTLEN